MKQVMLVFGHGYVSGFLATQLIERGWSVCATSRSLQRQQLSNGIQLIPFSDPGLKEIIDSADAILSTVPPNAGERDPVLSVYETMILQSNARWIAYLSASSVYGNHDGRWVDEESACLPSDERSKQRLLAEESWFRMYEKFHKPIHVFRLSGIYGPKRNALNRIRQGYAKAIVKEGHYFSRIHVLDICRALLASLDCPTPGEVYNVSDDEPAPIHEVQLFSAKMLGEDLLQIPFEKAALTTGMQSFFEANKKVSAQKIKDRLSYNCLYPTYREGLADC